MKKLSEKQVGDILTKLLKKTNYSWWNEEFLYAEYTNEYLSFHIQDTRYSYNRLHRSKKTLYKLLKNIFICQELEGLNDYVFVGGYTYFNEDRRYERRLTI